MTISILISLFFKSVDVQGVFFHWASPKKTKSKIVLEYPDWASPGLPKKVKVQGVFFSLGLP